jgi:hypothetical protein
MFSFVHHSHIDKEIGRVIKIDTLLETCALNKLTLSVMIASRKACKHFQKVYHLLILLVHFLVHMVIDSKHSLTHKSALHLSYLFRRMRLPKVGCVMLIVGCTSQDGRPAKSARRSDREDEDMTHAYL